MARFIFTYHAAAEYTPDNDAMGAWGNWFESMGEHVEVLGNPVSESTAIGEVGDSTRLGGYSIVTADDLEAAKVLAKGCPTLKQGGGVRVGKLEPVHGS